MPAKRSLACAIRSSQTSEGLEGMDAAEEPHGWVHASLTGLTGLVSAGK